MPQYTCPRCQKHFSAPASETPSRVMCPHCKNAIAVPATGASRWYVSPGKKRHGPFTWRQLLTLAQRGDLIGDDLLIKEGEQQWVRAATLPPLFVQAPQPKPDDEPNGSVRSQTSRRGFPRLVVVLCGLCGV